MRRKSRRCKINLSFGVSNCKNRLNFGFLQTPHNVGPLYARHSSLFTSSSLNQEAYFFNQARVTFIAWSEMLKVSLVSLPLPKLLFQIQFINTNYRIFLDELICRSEKTKSSTVCDGNISRNVCSCFGRQIKNKTALRDAQCYRIFTIYLCVLTDYIIFCSSSLKRDHVFSYFILENTCRHI